MLGLRKVIHVAVVMTALVWVTSSLASAARPGAKSAANRCEWAAAHKAHLGAPLITDARGPGVAILFVDQRDNYLRFCLYTPDGGVGSSGQIRSPVGSPNPAPGPNGIQHNHWGGSCDSATGKAVGEMFGRAGANVTGATFTFSRGAPEDAVVKHGFFVVWWQSLQRPKKIALTLKSGTTTEIHMQSRLPQRSC